MGRLPTIYPKIENKDVGFTTFLFSVIVIDKCGEETRKGN